MYRHEPGGLISHFHGRILYSYAAMSSFRLSWGITPAYHRFPHHSLIEFTPKLKIRLIKSTATPRPARTSIQYKNDEEPSAPPQQTDRQRDSRQSRVLSSTHTLTHPFAHPLVSKQITVSTTSSMFDNFCLASNLQHFLLHLPQTCIRHVWNEYTCRNLHWDLWRIERDVL